jgi:hypothetical protein
VGLCGKETDGYGWRIRPGPSEAEDGRPLGIPAYPDSGRSASNGIRQPSRKVSFATRRAAAGSEQAELVVILPASTGEMLAAAWLRPGVGGGIGFREPVVVPDGKREGFDAAPSESVARMRPRPCALRSHRPKHFGRIVAARPSPIRLSPSTCERFRRSIRCRHVRSRSGTGIRGQLLPIRSLSRVHGDKCKDRSEIEHGPCHCRKRLDGATTAPGWR